MSNKRLIALHRLLKHFFKNKQQVISTNDFKRLEKYKKNFKKNLSNSITESNINELSISINSKQIILVGDFHTFENIQNLFIKISSLSNKEPLLALEAFDKKDQKLINNFLEGKNSEEKFLEETSYYKKWGFPWRGYKNIFAYAKDKCSVIGIDNKGETLKQRDKAIAKRLVGLSKLFPNNKIVCLIGQHHLSEQHLLKELQRLNKKKGSNKESTNIFFNIEEYFYDLLKNKTKFKKLHFLKTSTTNFCIIDSSPWLTWFNHLIWEKQQNKAEQQKYKPYYKKYISPKTFEFDYNVSILSKILESLWKQKLDDKYYDYLDVVLKEYQVTAKGDSEYLNIQGYSLNIKENKIFFKNTNIETLLNATSEFYFNSLLFKKEAVSNAEIALKKILCVLNVTLINPFVDKGWFLNNSLIEINPDFSNKPLKHSHENFKRSLSQIKNLPLRGVIYFSISLGIELGKEFIKQDLCTKNFLRKINPKKPQSTIEYLLNFLPKNSKETT
jgi:hypothetical protein